MYVCMYVCICVCVCVCVCIYILLFFVQSFSVLSKTEFTGLILGKLSNTKFQEHPPEESWAVVRE